MSKHSQKLENLYKLARQAKADDNSENAQKYYDMISIQNPDDWEAAFYSVYYQAMQTNIAGISNAADNVRKAAYHALGLIGNSNEPKSEKVRHVREILYSVEYIGNLLRNAAKRHYNSIDVSVRGDFAMEFSKRISAVDSMQHFTIIHAGERYGCEVDSYLKSTFDACLKPNIYCAERANDVIVQYDPSFDGAKKIAHQKKVNKISDIFFCIFFISFFIALIGFVIWWFIDTLSH